MATPITSGPTLIDQQQPKYDGSNDGWCEFSLAGDGETIPLNYRLYHTNDDSVALMKFLGDNIKREFETLMFINDLSVVDKHAPIASIEGNILKDMDLNEIKLSKASLTEIRKSIQEDLDNYEGSKFISDAELIRTEKYGEIIAYMNPFMYQMVGEEIVITRFPGSQAIRSKGWKNHRTYSMLRHYRKNDKALGIECFMTFNWNDPVKNTHIVRPAADYSGMMIR